jgi:RNA polymerase sigma-70 factor (ECF subfamily)
VDDLAESQCVQQAQAGDHQAFATLVECYWPRIYHWLCKMTHNSHAAEDLTQDVFLKAWSGIGSFKGPGGFKTWVFRIASNSLIDIWRAARSETPRPLPESLSSREPGPVAMAVGQESQVLLQEVCDRLPVKLSAALLLRTQEHFSFAEIATILDINEQTVRWRICKARQLLLEELKPRGIA